MPARVRATHFLELASGASKVECPNVTHDSGVVHGALGSSPAGFTHWYLFFFGIVLGLAREWTGNIWVPVWMHCVNNVLATWEMLRYTS